jgi:hypothetical protein
VKSLLILLSGLTFLNMSFILAELNAVGVGKQSSLFQNIMNAGVEEEKETDTSSESDGLENEEYLGFDFHLLLTKSGHTPINRKICNRDFGLFDSGYLESFSPPPENLSI